MTTRLIRITECAECPNRYQDSRGLFCHFGDGQPPMCPPTGKPEWCPWETEPFAAILLRTIAAEAERTGSWHVPPDLQERVRVWVAERDGGAR